MLDLEFLKKAEVMRDPVMGTENVAPFLYYLIRSTRPQTVLEYGIGFSTLFILKALSDNLNDYNNEKEALINKKSDYPQPISSDDFRNWFFDESAPLLNPFYYKNKYNPQLICFEKLPATHEYTQNVLNTITDLKLERLLTLIEGRAPEQSTKIPSEYLPIDLAWNDDDAYYNFFTEYWHLINPNGGCIIYHSTTNSSSKLIAEMNKIKAKLKDNKNHEIINISEPHKLHQCGFTIIKNPFNAKEIHVDQPAFQEQIYDSFLDLINKNKLEVQ